MSKKTQKTADTMLREMVAKMVQTAGTRPEGSGIEDGGLKAESGTASLYLESLQDLVNRLHAERGDAVKRAKAARITWGFDSRNFQDDWKYVEVLTGQIAEAEAVMETFIETPLKRAAIAAMDLVAMIGKLSDDDAVKAIEVLKSGVRVQMLAREQGKAGLDAAERLTPTGRKMTQVYLRWHIDLTEGGAIESNGLPYFAEVKHNSIGLVSADLVYLENERRALTANGRTGSVHLRMMELPDNGSGYRAVNQIVEVTHG